MKTCENVIVRAVSYPLLSDIIEWVATSFLHAKELKSFPVFVPLDGLS